MRMQISLRFLLVSTLCAGAFAVPSSWGNALKVTLESEVAGITSDRMTLPPEKDMLMGNRNPDRVASSANYSDFKKESKVKNPYASAKKEDGMGVKYANAGFIVSNLAPAGTIIKLFDQKLGTSGPDEVFVDIGRRQGLKKGDRFTVYSLGRYIYHPVQPGQGKEEAYTRRTGYGEKVLMSHPGKPLGHRVDIHGVLEITEPGDKVSYARVVKAYGSIETGHLLLPYQKFEDLSAEPTKTDKTIEGYIVASKGDKIGVMSDDIVYIDKGRDDRVQPGDHFEVFTIPDIEENIWNKMEPKKTPLLPYVLGKLKVIATQNKTATAIVVKSRLDMKVGDRIRFKRSDHPG